MLVHACRAFCLCAGGGLCRVFFVFFLFVPLSWVMAAFDQQMILSTIYTRGGDYGGRSMAAGHNKEGGALYVCIPLGGYYAFYCDLDNGGKNPDGSLNWKVMRIPYSSYYDNLTDVFYDGHSFIAASDFLSSFIELIPHEHSETGHPLIGIKRILNDRRSCYLVFGSTVPESGRPNAIIRDAQSSNSCYFYDIKRSLATYVDNLVGIYHDDGEVEIIPSNSFLGDLPGRYVTPATQA
jgi:hypothetical protein